MITYIAKEGFDTATYARACRQRAFTAFLSQHVPGAVSYVSDVGGSSSTVVGALGAAARLGKSLGVTWAARNDWVVLDYPNFPASVPRRLPVFVAATAYLAALRVACRLTGARIVVQTDDDPALQDRWLGLPLSRYGLVLERLFERLLFRCADRLWVSGRTAADMLCERHRLPPERVTHVPNGATLPARIKVLEDDGALRFVYAGALHPETHGVAALMRAFSGLPDPDVRLVLAGSGGEWIPAYLDRWPDGRVLYVGCLETSEAQALLAECHVGVLVGQRGGYHDTGFPGKLGAYLAAGLPVVSTCDGDGARLIRDNGNGVLCDETRLGAVMGELAADTSRYAALKRSAEALQEDYLWERIYARAVDGLGTGRRASARGMRMEVRAK